MNNEINVNEQPNIDTWENGTWVQLNVGLVRHQGDALSSARVLFSRIEPIVNHWRGHGLLRWFFFMRKPPDVRLRFFTKVNQQQAIAEISQLMSALQQENYINLFFFSEYQPETERFGGTEAMQLVHQYFDIDTSLWLILDDLYQHHLSVVPKDVLIPSLIHDLFTRIMPDQISVLSTWHSLSDLIPTDPEAIIPTVDLQSIKNLYQSYSVTDQENNVLIRYSNANRILAQQLINLQDINLLNQGMPGILAAIAMFTFHRHGFDWRRSGKLVTAIICLLKDKVN